MDPPPTTKSHARGADDEITRARRRRRESSIDPPTDGRPGRRRASARATRRRAPGRRRATRGAPSRDDARRRARNANGRDAIRPHEEEGRGERARIDGDATTTMALETPSSLGNDDRAAMMIQAAYRRHQARADAGRRAKTTALETLAEPGILALRSVTKNHRENTLKLQRAGGLAGWLDEKSSVVPPNMPEALR